MNDTDPTSLSLARQRLCCEIVAEAVEKGTVAPEQLLRMLTAEVGQTESEVVYRENKLAVHHYEPDEQRHETPIFVVYALVNQPYILDLQPDRSVVRRLLEAGFSVYLVDWGEPSRLDADLTLTDYVCRYLDNCVEAVLAHADADDLHMLGYCMGGTMAAMYAARNSEPIRTLGWMATPYSFDGDAGILERWATHFDPDGTVDALGNVPGDLLAVEFSLMDPVEHYLGKYVRLYDNLEDEDFVTNFARMERWIWDGVDVAGETFREFVGDLYREDQLAAGTFELAGEPVDVSRIDVPVLGIVGAYDHIVPPESSTPLVEDVGSDDTRLIEFEAGHIGISVSSSAHERLWPEVTDWFAARSESVDSADASEADDASATTTESSTAGASDATDERARARETVESVARQAARMATADGGPAAITTEATRGASEPVETVDGVGPTYADRLREAGVQTVDDLRQYEAAELATVADAPAGRTQRWLDQVT